jgi:DNA polymerase
MKYPKDVVNYQCRDCILWKTRTQVVWGDGFPTAQLGFIGEGPGREEDETGIAFVGKAGRLLRKILGLLRLKRKVIILNLVKCRPPQNRPPLPSEFEACSKYLYRQIDALPNLRVIVVLGRVPWKFLTGKEEPVIQNRGKTEKWHNQLLLYTYHPSFLARSHDKDRLKEFIKDLKKAKAIAGIRK